MNEKWDWRFMQLAQHVATWSKDPSTQVGAVIVDDKRRVVSHGYNGFPRGVEDREERYFNKDVKHSMVVHAEANAILTAARSVDGCTIYSSLLTCNECAKLVIQSGIRRVVSPWGDGKWRHGQEVALQMYKEADVQVDLL